MKTYRFAIYEGTPENFWEEEIAIKAASEQEAYELAETRAKKELVWPEFEMCYLK